MLQLIRLLACQGNQALKKEYEYGSIAWQKQLLDIFGVEQSSFSVKAKQKMLQQPSYMDSKSLHWPNLHLHCDKFVSRAAFKAVLQARRRKTFYPSEFDI